MLNNKYITRFCNHEERVAHLRDIIDGRPSALQIEAEALERNTERYNQYLDKVCPATTEFYKQDEDPEYVNWLETESEREL